MRGRTLAAMYPAVMAVAAAQPPDPATEVRSGYILGPEDQLTIRVLEAEQIDNKPYDVITIPRGELVYVMGQVRRPGGFVLRQRDALSLAEGLDRAAAPQNARILRTMPGASRCSEIYVDFSAGTPHAGARHSLGLSSGLVRRWARTCAGHRARIALHRDRLRSADRAERLSQDRSRGGDWARSFGASGRIAGARPR